MLNQIHLLLLILLLVACASPPADGNTAVSAPPAADDVTAVDNPPTAVATVAQATATASPTALSPTKTPSPTPTPLPLTPPPPVNEFSVTPEPTLPAIVDDIWVSGYIMGERMEGCPFQVGAFSDALRDVWIPCLTLAPAMDEIAAEFTAVPPGDTLLQLSGSLNTTTPAPPIFTVTELNYVNYPYSSETPLDATYTSDRWGIAFDYPAGWDVAAHTDADAIVISSMPPGTTFMRPGREHLDPTEYRVEVRLGADTLAQWQAIYADMAGPAPALSQIQVGEHTVGRVEWTVYGVVVEYGVEVNGRFFIFNSNDIGEAFMARVVATLRPLKAKD